MKNFEPKVVVFCCNWCSPAGVDLAGSSKLKSNLYSRIIKTTCTGRIEPSFILRAFAKGADGVIIAGCHPGDCHYISGNLKARRIITLIKNLLPQLGIELERLRLEWISTSEAEKFQSAADEFMDEVTKLGSLRQIDRVKVK
jgi:F420-non-reducing hydrogenase iron-sulfur subunit